MDEPIAIPRPLKLEYAEPQARGRFGGTTRALIAGLSTVVLIAVPYAVAVLGPVFNSPNLSVLAALASFCLALLFGMWGLCQTVCAIGHGSSLVLTITALCSASPYLVLVWMLVR